MSVSLSSGSVLELGSWVAVCYQYQVLLGKCGEGHGKAGHVQGAGAADSGLSEPCSFAATDVGGIDIVEDEHAGEEGVCRLNMARWEKIL